MSEIEVVKEQVISVYDMAVEHWLEEAGGLAKASTALKAGAAAGQVIPYISVFIDMFAMAAEEERMVAIEKAIDGIKRAIRDLYKRLAAIDERLSRGENKTKELRLDTIADQVEIVIKKARLPGNTPADMVRYCIDLEVQCKNFLETRASAATGEMMSFDVWRSAQFKPSSNSIINDRFSTWPTLHLYATALIAWARMRAIARAGGAVLPAHNDAAIDEHVAQLTSRPGFRHGARPEPGEALTLLETAMSYVNASYSAASRGLECVLTEHAHDQMGQYWYSQETGREDMEPGTFCNLDSWHITAGDEPSLLRVAEDIAGIGFMRQLHDLIETKVPAGTFAPPIFLAETTLYLCFPDGDLQLQRITLDDSVAAITEGKSVGNGWAKFRKAIGNGQFAIYGLAPDGSLHWYWHKGHDQGEFEWVGPIPQRTFNAYKELWGSSDGVFYAVGDDGLIDWYRHEGVGSGDPLAWRGPVRMPPVADWSDAVSVFGLGDGRLYVLRADGTLTWHHHPGYLSGAPDLSPGKLVGRRWDNYRLAFTDRSGQIFGLTGDGELHAYRHHGAKDGIGLSEGNIWVTDRVDIDTDPFKIEGEDDGLNLPPPQNGSGSAPVVPRSKWNGPAQVATGLEAIQYMFALGYLQPPVH